MIPDLPDPYERHTEPEVLIPTQILAGATADSAFEALRCPHCQQLDVHTLGPEPVLYCQRCGHVYGG